MNEFDVFAVSVAVAAGLLGAAGALRGPSSRGTPAGLTDVLRGGAWIAGLAIVVCAAGRPAGLLPFGVIRILYVAGVISVPLAACCIVLAAATGRVRATRPAVAALAGALLLAPLGGWMTFVEPYRLRTERTDVVVAEGRAGGEPLRIGVLADLQCEGAGEHERRAVERLLAEAPDLILIPGDFMQVRREVWPERSAELRDLLSKLDAPGGVWAVLGDVDRGDTPDVLATTRVRFLHDEVARVHVRGCDVAIGGVSLDIPGDTHPVVRELERDPERGDIRILVAHRPDAVLGLRPRSRIDMTVAGHTHGGQIVVPGFGPPMTLSLVPRHVAAGGLHEIDGNRVYVSRGVGMERMQAPRMRLFCPPEISILTVTGGHAAQ